MHALTTILLQSLQTHAHPNDLYCPKHLKEHQKNCRPRSSAERCVDICTEAIKEKEKKIKDLQEELEKSKKELQQLKEEKKLADAYANKKPSPKKRKAAPTHDDAVKGGANCFAPLPPCFCASALDQPLENPEVSQILKRVRKLQGGWGW